MAQALTTRNEAAPSGFGSLRQSASRVLAEVQLPTRKDEAWRRTDMSSVFAARPVRPPGLAAGASLEAWLSPDTAGRQMVFVDGVFDAALSDLSALPDAVYAGSLGELPGQLSAQAHAKLAPLPETVSDKRTELGSHALAALNHASLADVAVVHVGAAAAAGAPLQVLFLSTGPGMDCEGDNCSLEPAPTELAVSHPNLLVWVEEGASLELYQHYAGAGAYFANAITRVALGEGASVRHVYVQEQGGAAAHVDSLCVSCAANSAYSNQLVQSGGRIARVNIDVSLDGGGAEADLQGLALATGRQLSDVHSRITHAVPDCVSKQEQRNALAGGARVVFRGAVVVPRGADNTTANQLCRSLLLSDSVRRPRRRRPAPHPPPSPLPAPPKLIRPSPPPQARVDIAPCLEIDTDDVVCTHGATVADLDDEMIFYLQARGLDRLQARALLLEGWARDFMSHVPSKNAKDRAADKAAQLSADVSRQAARVQSMQSI